MSNSLLLELKEQLENSVQIFLQADKDLDNEIRDDMLAVVEAYDIAKWMANIDGQEKNFSQLLSELNEANYSVNQQQCIESIAMLRLAISDIASAFSNAMDCMEKMVVTIRDNE